MTDARFIQLTLQLARKGSGRTSPNPMVGAVVVKRGEIIAKGYHQRFGGPHAEAVVLHACGDKAQGATLYVNLEPCCHYGKTPPCTDLIIQSGIKRVVCSTIDPNPQVNGKGMESLKKAGIVVSVGMLEQEAKKLNEVYFKYITAKLPFVVLKVIATLDGKIIPPSRLAKLLQRTMPSAYENYASAGIDAILWDSSMTNNYDPKQANSMKLKMILMGTWNEIRSKLKGSRHKNIILAPIDGGSMEKSKEGEFRIWNIKKRKNRELDLLWLLKKAGEEGITSLLVEVGNKLLTSFLKQRLVDKIWYQIVPVISGKGEEPFGDLDIRKMSDAITLKDCEFKRFKNSLLVVGYPF